MDFREEIRNYINLSLEERFEIDEHKRYALKILGSKTIFKGMYEKASDLLQRSLQQAKFDPIKKRWGVETHARKIQDIVDDKIDWVTLLNFYIESGRPLYGFKEMDFKIGSIQTI